MNHTSHHARIKCGHDEKRGDLQLSYAPEKCFAVGIVHTIIVGNDVTGSGAVNRQSLDLVQHVTTH